MPDHEYRHRLTAAEDDLDELAHVNNVVYLRWVQDAALAHSRAVGFEISKWRALGAAFVVRKHEIEFLQPTFAGDELELVTWVERWRAASSLRETRVVRLRDEVLVARATTLWVFTSLETGGPARIPASVRESFTRPRGDARERAAAVSPPR
ncbi:MAG: acyl-CoA thioesterase [Myxococcales bacterium]|nr:acyl-CoA thioesterase [Myxococcales bacterium]